MRTINDIVLPQGVAQNVLATRGYPEWGPFTVTVRHESGAPCVPTFCKRSDLREDGSLPIGERVLSALDTARANEASGYVGAADPEPAVLLGGAYPLNLAPGDQVVLSVAGAGDDPATFDAAAGFDQTKAEPYVLADGNTLIVEFNGDGVDRTFELNDVDFVDITVATKEELRDWANDKMAAFQLATLVGNDVRFTSLRVGNTSRVEFKGGTGLAALVLDGETVGTGDVSDIDAVTAAEFKAVVEADIAGVVVDETNANVRILTVDTGADATLRAQAATADAFGFVEGAPGQTAGDDGVLTLSFTGQTLNNLPIAPFSVWVHGPGSSQQLYDKYGNGKLYLKNADPALETWPGGTIDYATGAITLVYTVAPTDGSILVDYVSTTKVGVAGPTSLVGYRVPSIGKGEQLVVFLTAVGGNGRATAMIDESP